MNSVGRPWVFAAVVDETCPHRVEVDIGRCERQVTLGSDWLRVESLLEELPRCPEALVSDLRVALSDASYEVAKRTCFKWRHQQMNVIRHETQPVSANLGAHEVTIHQADEEEIVPWVREQSAAIVAPQDDVMRNPF